MVIIAFEGIDGTGKSTSIRLTSDFLASKAIPHLVTQELSGGEMQLKFRQMLIESATPMDELLVISLARRWHYDNVLKPALEAGKCILMDRYIESTWAYQGQNIEHDVLSFFEQKVWQTPKPDVVIYFDGNSLRAKARDRFEQKGTDFFAMARKIYKSRAANYPNWVSVIAGEQERVNSAILQAIG